jgi:ATP-dependent Lon protease
MLDEVDKLGRDYRGDPSHALLEVLDPAQNSTFRDNYLDLPFDLSKVFFIMTANSLDGIPRPLLDRMEVIRLSGYSEEEKVQIAVRYLLPRQLEHTGLTAEKVTVTPEALRRIISRYTREAGVRELERQLGRVTRKAARLFAEGRTEPLTVEETMLFSLLGQERNRPEKSRRELPPGVATGLAWTETGGDVLYVEATLLLGSPGLHLTGQLGKVMKESARAAHSLVWSRAEELGINPRRMRRDGVHIHVPAGAVPKDGPSAGVAMVTAIASLLTGNASDSGVAMTGEITLTGLVLPVGGIKEKILGARRAGIRKVVLPKENEADLRDLPETVRAEMEFTLAERIEDALAVTLPTLARKLHATV